MIYQVLRIDGVFCFLLIGLLSNHCYIWLHSLELLFFFKFLMLQSQIQILLIANQPITK